MSEGEVESTATASVLAACPVCRARPRGALACRRCGADLTPIQRCVLEAWRMRRAAREALRDERFEDGLRLARASVLLQATPAGRRLEVLAGLVVRAAVVPAPNAQPEPPETDPRDERPALESPPPDPLPTPVPEPATEAIEEPVAEPIPGPVALADHPPRPRSQSIPWWRRLFLRRRP